MISFNNVTFASLGLGAGNSRGEEPGPEVRALTLNRRGYLPVHVGLERGTKTLEAEFLVKTNLLSETTLLTALGIWDPDDETERVLAAELNDGTPVSIFAALGQYRFATANQLLVDFSLADPAWRKTTPDRFGPVSWAYDGSAQLPTPNAGNARSNLIVTITPTALAPSGEFPYRRQFSVVNTSDMALRRHPLEIPFGDASTWSGTPAPGYVWVYLDGIAQPMTPLAGFGLVGQSYGWILIDELGPGQSLTYDVCWNGHDPAPTLTGTDAPAFDITSAAGAARAPFNTTTLNDVSGIGWEPNQFVRGRVRIQTGTGAGQERDVMSNTASSLVVFPGWDTAPAASSRYLLRTSTNERWLYAVRQTERSGAEVKRGLWYINRGQSKPSKAVFDVPGGWYRLLRYDNNDEKNQSRWAPVIPAGQSNVDYFSILDADRTAQGWTSLTEQGQADSVGFSSPLPLTGFRFNYRFKNPNGIGRAFFGCRESGAEDWETCFEDAGIYQGLQSSSIRDETFTTDIRHLVATLGPANDEAIPVSWIKDQGSRTGGGTITLFDDTKEWSTNQWQNATCRIVSGTGKGQSRKVASNTSVGLTLATPWTTTPSDDSRYELINHVLVATLRCQDTWEVRLSPSAIGITPVASETPIFVQKRALILRSSDDAGAAYQEIRVGLDARRVFVQGDQELRIDGTSRRAAIYHTASGAFVRDVTSGVLVQQVESSLRLFAADWLLVLPTRIVLANGAFTGSRSDWSLVEGAPGVTIASSYDAAIYHDSPGALAYQITTSAAAAGATVAYGSPVAPPPIPVTPGQAYSVGLWTRALNLNWAGQPGIAWYDGGGALLSTSYPTAFTSAPALTWAPAVFSAIAPVGAVTMRVLAAAIALEANVTGMVWFDDVTWQAPRLEMSTQPTDVTVAVTASLTAGWYA